MDDFWVSFAANFLADLAIVVLVTVIAKDFYNLILKPKPKLSFVVKQGPFYSDTIKLSRKEDGNYETSFNLVIKNSGNATLKSNEGYWHVFTPNADKLQYFNGAEGFAAAMEETHQRNSITSQIYPHSFLEVGLEYKYSFIKKEGEKNFKPQPLYYFFQTDYGNFPSTAKIDKKDGKVLYKDMGVIHFELPT
jgi:hypothetical protein